jgi:predicted amidohydrolase
MKTVKIGLIQMTNPASLQVDYAHPTSLVEQAVRQGAELVVFPETCPCGYIPNQRAWQLAEPREGPTVDWASALAQEHQITIGAGFVEYDGVDFFNTFFLVDETGVLGFVRKRTAESYCYKSADSPPSLIATRHGKVAVGICADNHMTPFLQGLMGMSPDIMLMPHARATPHRVSQSVSQKDVEAARQQVIDFPILYSKVLGIPTVFTNPVGEMEVMTGLLGKFMSPEAFRLQGGSLVVAADGSIIESLGDREDIAVVEVELTRQEPAAVPKDFGGWLHEGNPVVRKIMLPFDIWQGQRVYNANKKKFNPATLRSRPPV